jgi:hypothetical protein
MQQQLHLSLSSLSTAIVKTVKRHKKPRSLVKSTMEGRKEGRAPQQQQVHNSGKQRLSDILHTFWLPHHE